jgi:hypothetical protein
MKKAALHPLQATRCNTQSLVLANMACCSLRMDYYLYSIFLILRMYIIKSRDSHATSLAIIHAFHASKYDWMCDFLLSIMYNNVHETIVL